MMDKNEQFKKSPCTKCGNLCYPLCYVDTKLVCVDCFQKAAIKQNSKMNVRRDSMSKNEISVE